VKYTYFVRAGSNVKIGQSRNPKARVDQIAVSCPATPRLLKIAAIPEKEAHATAEKLAQRVNGEWFEDAPALMEWIEGIEDAIVEATKRKSEPASPVCRAAVVSGMNAPLTLPIHLSDLPQHTRDWLLAKSARLGVSPLVALNDTLSAIAQRELGNDRKPRPERGAA